MAKGNLLFVRMAADLDNNPKIIRSGRNGREVFLFVLRQSRLREATGSKGGGWVPLATVAPWYLARQLQMPVDDAQDGVTSAVDAALLVLLIDRCAVVGWDDEWSMRAMSDNERKQKERDTPSRFVTDSHDGAAATVTVRDASRDVTIVTHKSEREKEIESGDTPPLAALKTTVARVRSKPRTAFPEGWTPAKDPDANELARFRDHHLAKGSVFADWEAAWRTWRSNGKRFAERDRAGKPKQLKIAAPVDVDGIPSSIRDWGEP